MANFSYFLIMLISPFFLFANFENDYAKIVSESFQEQKFDRCLEILEEWQKEEPLRTGEVLGIKAAINLCLGKLEESKSLMDLSLKYLDQEKHQNPFFNSVLQMYYKIMDSGSNDLDYLSTTLVRLCAEDQSKFAQPRGVKLRFWASVGQILAGVLLMPINPAAGGTLIFSGAVQLVDVTGDALDNKDEWERNLNERQRLNPGANKNFFSTLTLDLIVT